MEDRDIESLLAGLGTGERTSQELLEALYAELHAVADRLMKRERDSHTLQPTALVHEAFLRLVDSDNLAGMDRLRFIDAAAVSMRRVLVDHARAAQAEKRGGGQRPRITLSGIEEDTNGDDVDILGLEEALADLKKLNERHARIIELRFYGGMTGTEIAEHLQVSRKTVVRDLAFSRAWLFQRMSEG